MTEKWQITDEHLEALDCDDAKFVFEHAEKRLKELVVAYQDIITRTTTLLTIITGFIVALLGFIISKWDKNQTFDAFLITSILSGIYLFVVCLYLKENIQPTEYHVPGADPKFFFTPNFFPGAKLKEKQRLLYYYVNEIEAYEKRIGENTATNNKRWQVYRRSLLSVIYFPIVACICYAVINLLPNSMCF